VRDVALVEMEFWKPEMSKSHGYDIHSKKKKKKKKKKATTNIDN
jgi:mRNA deadenylase 3'-5' endonuclease subunit Ccr4